MKKHDLQEIAVILGLPTDALKLELVDAIRNSIRDLPEFPSSLDRFLIAGRFDGVESESETANKTPGNKPTYLINAVPKSAPPKQTLAKNDSNLFRSPSPKPTAPIEKPLASFVQNSAPVAKSHPKSTHATPNRAAKSSFYELRKKLSSSKMVIGLFIALEFYMYLRSFSLCSSSAKVCSVVTIPMVDFEILKSYDTFWKPLLLYGFYMNILPFLVSFVIHIEKKRGDSISWSVFTFSVVRYAICFGYLLEKQLFNVVFEHISSKALGATCAVGVLFSTYEAINRN